MSLKYKQIKKLDTLDNILIYLISCGGNSLSYLSSVLHIPKQTLSDRITRLSILNLVDSIDSNQKHIYRKYVLTSQGEAFVYSMDIFSNIFLLKSELLSDG